VAAAVCWAGRAGWLPEMGGRRDNLSVDSRKTCPPGWTGTSRRSDDPARITMRELRRRCVPAGNGRRRLR
jgi:hypothetical protein